MTAAGRPPGCDGRRLRFEYDLQADESVPGALIAALGSQWLDDARPVLQAAGLSAARPGALGLASPAEARRLAWLMRCDPAALLARLGRRDHGGKGSGASIEFGGIVLPRRRLETQLLRIAPESLAESGHHRLAWADRALGYCPTSLERLVYTCQACDRHLQWTQTGRLDTCGRCGSPVAPSKEAHLPGHLADGYRAFTALSSPLHALRQPAIDRLPHRLSDVPPGLLVRLALHVGGLLHEPPINTTLADACRPTAAESTSAAAASGWRMLEGWPASVTDGYRDAARTVGRDRAAFERLRTSLRRLVGVDEPAQTRTLVLEALPDLAKHASHSFAVSGRYYISRDVSHALGVKTVDMPRLRGWSDLRFVAVPSLSRTLGHYDADQIDDLAALLRSSRTVESASWTLDLPTYGAEQLVEAGLLQHRDHGAFRALGRDRHVSDESVADLEKRILSVLSDGAPPTNSIPLRLAMRSFGGGPKPWAAIATAVLRGDIRAWRSGDHSGFQSLRIDDASYMSMVDALPAMGSPCRTLVPADTISQVDAAEILNVDHKSILTAARDLKIPFHTQGRGLAAPVSSVCAAAASVVWASEIRRRLGCAAGELRRTMADLDLPAMAGGWCRRSAVSAGLPIISTPIKPASTWNWAFSPEDRIGEDRKPNATGIFNRP